LRAQAGGLTSACRPRQADELLAGVTRVSVETVRIVQALERLPR
jgi:hypothetical protein